MSGDDDPSSVWWDSTQGTEREGIEWGTGLPQAGPFGPPRGEQEESPPQAGTGGDCVETGHGAQPSEDQRAPPTQVISPEYQP